MVCASDGPRAPATLATALDEPASHAPGCGIVHLVGAGPGDPELLTLRALRLLQQADVIVYDNLIGEGILELARRDAERIYVGKRCDRHSLRQEEINKLLVNLASAGKRVVRLKGGDPFLFGRGGEELETLAACGIPFEVVPGVTAANGVAACAGIPLTHRDYAQSCVFATGHLKDGTVNLDWAALARPRQTVVIYMGLGGLAEICRQLTHHGLPATTPAAAVQSGTTRNQRVLTGMLSTLPDLVAAVGLVSPVLLIVGEVVKLHRRLDWFAPVPSAEPAQPEAGIGPLSRIDAETLMRMQRHTT
jgi:uroporphyrin-III C-methyltransferase/precorrin-2 dehydrogenase/sirohydrochlorin ferrochelatase